MSRPAFVRSDWTRYLGWMLGTLLGVVGAVGAFNIVVDSLGVFGSARIVGFNAIKPYLDHDREITRWRAAQRICPNAGIFGNSRAEIGFDPENPLFAARGLSAFNHATPGERAHLAYRQIHWLRTAGCAPKVIVLGVEFFDFLGRTQPPAATGFAPDAAPTLDSRFFTTSVFSISGLRDSINTLLLQRARHPAMLTGRGFNPLHHYVPEIEQSGHYALFRQRALESAKIWHQKPKRLRAEGGGVLEDERAVDAILTQGAQAGSTVYIVIYPYHAQIRLMLERLGLGALFAEWKRNLVVIATRHAKNGAKVEVWDFSGITPETTEAIPAKGDRNTALKNFWEAGHFKKELGDRMMARMLGHAPDFGIELTGTNIDQWIAQDRLAVQQLLASPSPLRADVDDILSRIQMRK